MCSWPVEVGKIANKKKSQYCLNVFIACLKSYFENISNWFKVNRISKSICIFSLYYPANFRSNGFLLKSISKSTPNVYSRNFDSLKTLETFFWRAFITTCFISNAKIKVNDIFVYLSKITFLLCEPNKDFNLKNSLQIRCFRVNLKPQNQILNLEQFTKNCN
jgi:hypothetical protein